MSDAHLAFWTRTLWTDERSMRAFMFAPAHRAVMPKLLQWCDEAAVAHWLQETPEPPSWPDVHRRLQQEGRTSRVDHPSEAQMRFEIPPPKTMRQFTLKSPPRAQAHLKFISVFIEISLDDGMIFQYLLKYEKARCAGGSGRARAG